MKTHAVIAIRDSVTVNTRTPCRKFLVTPVTVWGYRNRPSHRHAPFCGHCTMRDIWMGKVRSLFDFAVIPDIAKWLACSNYRTKKCNALLLAEFALS